MRIRHKPWQIITAFIATIVAALFSSGSSKALSVENKAISGLTIEERLAKVREQLQKNNVQSPNRYDNQSSLHLYSEFKEVQISWRDWSDWSDWCDTRRCNN